MLWLLKSVVNINFGLMLSSQFDNILQEFTPIHLEEMNGVRLMNRMDTKFLLPLDRLEEVFVELKKDYRILEVEGVRSPTYESIYFDNDDLTFYSDHHRGKKDRYKVRFRKYVESDLTFLEVKHKAKGRTDKHRIMVEGLSKELSPEQNHFLENIGVPVSDLEYVLTNSFQRVSLVSKDLKERLTLDFNLTFRGNEGQNEREQVVIAELKQERVSRQSPFFQLMKKLHIRPYRLSKYCIGVIKLRGKENVKYNRFKSKLLRLKKLKNNVHAA